MAHEKLEFPMPAEAAVVFDAFHYHQWRSRWDSLVGETRVQGGSPCPFVGAISTNTGTGAMRLLSMSTRFVTYDRPRLAAASMVGRSFPFTRWAASMMHRPVDAQQSVLVYTYTFEVGPAPLRWLIRPVVERMFARQTRQRFTRLGQFLAVHAAEVRAWQQSLPPAGVA